jgi:hypothetical protein
MPSSESKPHLFARYERALESLAQLPPTLERELGAAQAGRDESLSAAESSAASAEARIKELRRSLAASFGRVVVQLVEADVLLPAQVRPAGSVAGDERTLVSAVEAQRAAERVVADELRAAAADELRRTADYAGNCAASRDAAAALERRREQVREAHARRDADLKRHRRAEAEHARQRRARIALLAIAVSVVIALALGVAIL